MGRANSIRRNKAFDLTQAEFLKPQTRLDANKWLQKATFGAATPVLNLEASNKETFVAKAGSVDDAEVLMSQGYSSWLDAQLSADGQYQIWDDPLMLPISGQNKFGVPNGSALQNSSTWKSWLHHAMVYGTASVRVKTLYALSQIFALNSGGNAYEMTSYVDHMYRTTKQTNSSSYLTLLKHVTYAPVMARWLTYNGNLKSNPAISRQADENYAREVMQLFTIGTVCLNMDGTPMLDELGNTIPTYNLTDVKNHAAIMTGLVKRHQQEFRYLGMVAKDHDCNAKTMVAYPGGSPVVMPAQNESSGVQTPHKPDGHVITVVNANTFTVDMTVPAKFAPGQFNESNKIRYRFVNDINAPFVDGTVSHAKDATTATITKNAHGLTTGTVVFIKNCVEESVDAYLEHLFNHPTCPPFIAKALIKFFVTSNPTPDYVERVAKVFVNDGNGVRGNIASVVKAILLDREAIIPYGINTNNHGRYLPVFERMLKVARAFRNDVVHINDPKTENRVPLTYNKDVIVAEPSENNLYEQSTFRYFSEQPQPMYPPSVFNFYRPGYVPPGSTLADLNLTGPELQILTPESQTVWLNMVQAMCVYSTKLIWQHDSNNGNSRATLFDPRFSEVSRGGADLDPDANGWTVTEKVGTVITISGNRTLNASANFVDYGDNIFIWNRNTNEYAGAAQTTFTGSTGGFSLGAGVKTLKLSLINAARAANVNVGDVLDFWPAYRLPCSGFPTRQALTDSNLPATIAFQPFITMFYKAATYLPNTLAITTGQINVGIDYLESILCSRPISPETRALMTSAANLAITLTTNPSLAYLISNTPAQNLHYNNWQQTYNQIRIRRMIAVLLSSPEFAIQY